ncbi:hypothetical protein J0X14_14275 [Muricauda sp. CAU 1633]|nr:hypothetical protein [Muricauda sp. CAU 1633]MBO0323471.1 hypothetical protein [Muricauda sp. CAU 1633]
MGRILYIQQGTGLLFENGKKVGETITKAVDLGNYISLYTGPKTERR